MDLLHAIVPTLMALALAVPITTGYRRSRRRVSVCLGWALWVLTYLCSDFVVPWLAEHWHGRAAGSRMIPDPSGTIPMVLCGWIFPLICHCFGYILHEAVAGVRGLLTKTNLQ